MADQLFYGRLQSVSPIVSGSNSYVRVRGDFDTSSKTITNVIDVAGYLNIDYIKVGMTFVSTGPFTTGTTITAFDTVANTITVADFPASTVTNTLARISPADGDYYLPSASFNDPNTSTPVTVNDITGSLDSDYNNLTPIYAVLGAAQSRSNQALIPGRFHKYNIENVFYRNSATKDISLFVSWAEDGTEASSGDEIPTTAEQVVGIVSLTPSESLAPIFSDGIAGITNLPPGTNFAGYQIELQNFFDDLTISDIYKTGSLVAKNICNLNFTGSVDVSLSGSNGVTINVTGGSGASGSSGSSGTSGADGKSG